MTDAPAVEVWLVRSAEVDLDRAAALLVDDELERAGAFHTGTARGRTARGDFVAGRALTRAVMASMAGRAQRSIDLVVDDHGKPAVSGLDLRCNLSHSDGLVALAVTASEVEIGIDIETVRPIELRAALAERRFSARERRWLEVEGESADRRFLQVWTRKEATIKAIGATLAALDDIDTAAPRGLRWEATVEGFAGPVAGVDLQLDEIVGAVGSVAAQADDLQVRIHPMSEALRRLRG